MGEPSNKMSYRLKVLQKKPPPGWDLVEPGIEQFERQMKEAVEEPHEGKRKAECTWKIHKIHWERNRFIYNLHFVDKKISKALYDYLCRTKIADGPLIAKWRKPGYEYLCSLSAIDTRNTNYGTSSICRVPLHLRGDRPTPSITTGCITCASTDKGVPIRWCTRMNLQKRKAEAEPDVEDPEEDPEFAKRLRALRGEAEPVAPGPVAPPAAPAEHE